jgi:hypothetical protein
VKRRSFRLEQDLIDAVDAVSGHFGLNRTQYLRRALRSAVYGDASLLNTELRSPVVRSFLKKLATEVSRRRERSRTNRGSRLSLHDQLKGVRAALRSDQTPPQLKAGLRKRAAQLEKVVKREPNG